MQQRARAEALAKWAVGEVQRAKEAIAECRNTLHTRMLRRHLRKSSLSDGQVRRVAVPACTLARVSGRAPMGASALYQAAHLCGQRPKVETVGFNAAFGARRSPRAAPPAPGHCRPADFCSKAAPMRRAALPAKRE